MNELLVSTVVLAFVAVGSTAWALRERVRAATSEAELRVLRASAETHAELVRAQVEQSVGAVTAEILKRNEEASRNRDLLADARLDAHLKPLGETLTRFEEKVQKLEGDRQKEFGGMTEQISNMLNAATAARDETRKLADALRRAPNVRGRWGEQSLRNVLEACGLNDRFDFAEQQSVSDEEGKALRPDVTVRLAGGGVLVIDSKVNLNPYLDALDAPDDASRAELMARYTRAFKGHVDALSRKAYWDQFKKGGAEGSPAFVVMYVAGENFLSAALDVFPQVLDEARQNRVLIVTPTSLFALLQVVAMGWRAEDRARNAMEIARLGQDLHSRLATMTGHVQDLGIQLGRAVGRFNAFVGSLQDRVLPQARKFELLGSDHQLKSIPDLSEIEVTPKELRAVAAELTDTAANDAPSQIGLP